MNIQPYNSISGGDSTSGGQDFAVSHDQRLYSSLHFGCVGHCASSNEASNVVTQKPKPSIEVPGLIATSQVLPPTPLNSVDSSPTDSNFTWRPALESTWPQQHQGYFDALPVRASPVASACQRIEPTLMHKARRREQNRIAQRAFRERKESHAKQLEEGMAELRERHQALQEKYERLHDAHVKLREGIKVLVRELDDLPEEDLNEQSSAAEDG